MVWWAKIVSTFQRMPGWLQSMLVGAAIISAAGPIFGCIIYTVQGVLGNDSLRLMEAALLAVIGPVGGGVLGLSFYFTQFLRKKGFVRRWIGWSIIFNAYLLAVSVLILLGHAIDRRIELPRGADEPTSIGYMMVFGVMFGLITGLLEHILVEKTKSA